jgi:methylglutaconyl-CoA hydratase
MSVVLVEKQSPQITVIILNRPERGNALTIELMRELASAVENAASDPTQRILILRGAGKAFCTGLDLQEAAETTKAHASGEMVARVLLTLANTRLITVAAVHGAAIAGGAGIMSACDLVVAAEGTKIGYPEVRRGLVASLVMTFLRRQLRERDLRELLLMSQLGDAVHAHKIGLVNRVVPADHVDSAVREITAAILQGAPGALTNSKRLIQELWSSTVAEDIEHALQNHMQARESDEAKEGIAAFLEKRLPHWAEP